MPTIHMDDTGFFLVETRVEFNFLIYVFIIFKEPRKIAIKKSKLESFIERRMRTTNKTCL